MEKRSGLIPVPKDRWNIDGFYSEVPRLGTLQNKECYLLQEDLTKFDASHFTCGGAEIEKMDPSEYFFELIFLIQMVVLILECHSATPTSRNRARVLG